MIIEQDPAECLGKGIENFGAALAPKSEADGEIVVTFPVNSKESLEIWADG